MSETASLTNPEVQVHTSRQQQQPEGCFTRITNYISLSTVQTFILLWKNFIYSYKHPIVTVFRLILPTLVLLGLFFLNMAITNNAVQGDAGASAHPATTPIPRLPTPSDSTFGIILYYPPDNVTVHQVMTAFAKNQGYTISGFGNGAQSIDDCKDAQVCGFEDFENMKSALLTTKTKRINGAVAFANEENGKQSIFTSYWSTYSGPSGLSYALYYNGTRYLRNPFYPFSFSFKTPFDFSMTLQRGVDEALLQVAASPPTTAAEVPGPRFELDISRKPLPFVASANVYAQIPKDLILIIGCFFFYTGIYLQTLNAQYSINSERNLKLIEALKMMGLREFPYWCSWFITQTIYNFISVFIFVCAGYAMQFNFFLLTNPVILFLVFFIMGESLIAMFLMFSTCIRTNVCTNIIAFIVLIISLLFMLFAVDFMSLLSPTGKTVAPVINQYDNPNWDFLNIFPTYNFGKIAFDVLYKTRQIQNGTSYIDNVGYKFTDFFDMNFYNATELGFKNRQNVICGSLNLLFIFLTVPVFLLFTWYLDNVLPKTMGLRRPWYFPFQPSYWGYVSKDNLAVDAAVHKSNKFHSILPDTDEDIFKEYQSVIQSLETDPHHTEYPVKIIKLSKTYTAFLALHHSNKNALDSLTLSGEKGQVLVLLGHNGAGKSTTVNILTGMYTPSSGDVLVHGNSIMNNRDNVRKNMGVQLQEDILWPELSGYQHMKLFATVKGIPLREIPKVIKEKLDQVMLWEYRNQSASTYSGGMKRRLSLAISVLGDPRLLVLDEPTTGMDPAIKRKIWNLITEIKKDRTIILTTHSMEEAEAIGDKIAIMALGRLRAVGNTLHLKNRFGAGYNLDIVSGEETTEQAKLKINELCPTAKLETEASGTLTYSLPKLNKDVYSLFNFLEQESKLMKELGRAAPGQVIKKQFLVKDWLISHTTLEEVFLRITHGKDGAFVDNTKKGSTEAPSEQQLNVIMENSENAIGFIDITSSTTLAEARLLIVNGIEKAPRNFAFLSQGIPISRPQENHKLASTYVPLIVIREVQEQATQGASSSGQNLLQSAPQAAYVGQLESQVRLLMGELENMKARMAALEAENQHLKSSTQAAEQL